MNNKLIEVRLNIMTCKEDVDQKSILNPATNGMVGIQTIDVARKRVL
jgi:hypothetical protein